MEKREATALWLLPLAFVIGYRVLAQVIWQLVILAGERSTMTQTFCG